MKKTTIYRWLAIFAISITYAAGANPPAQEKAPPLADIQKRLASEDFATRQAAKDELDAIPADRIGLLQAAVQAENDAEVKAQLNARIDAMELYNMLHPPRLSLDVHQAGMPQLVDALNTQLGAKLVQERSSDKPGNPFTLKIENQPWWEILQQLDQQNPLDFDISGSFSASAGVMQVGNGDPNLPHDLKIIDSFALRLTVHGIPAKATWFLKVGGYSDPRIKTLQAGDLTIDKLTDQDGRNLLPLMMRVEADPPRATMFAPNYPCIRSILMNPVPGLTRIGELKGSIHLVLFQSIGNATLDLSNDSPASVNTPHGRVIAEKTAGGQFTFKLPDASGITTTAPTPVAGRGRGSAIPSEGPGARGVVVRLPVMRNPDGGVLHPILNIALTPGIERTVDRGTDLKDAEVLWVEKPHDFVLPVEYKNIDIPENGIPIPPPAVGGGG